MISHVSCFSCGTKLRNSRSLEFFCALAICTAFLVATGEVRAQSANSHLEKTSLGGVQDCTKIQMNYDNDPTLTNDEKLALMDIALHKSLSQFDACQSASNSGGGGGAAGGGGSVASTDMSGTETAPSDVENSSSSQSETAQEATISDEAGGNGSSTQSAAGLDNGKVPEDIPVTNNDSVLEAQIRQAAINETDPETQAKLWDEYRRYKGLPIKNKKIGGGI